MPLDTVVINPADTATASIIWLHGLGANGHDFVNLLPLLPLPSDHQWRFIFPHAPWQPITIQGGQTLRAWYDITTLDAVSQEDTAGLSKSRQAIDELIHAEHAAGIPHHRILLVGFSQGGALALHTGLLYPKPLGGILGLSCYLPLAQQQINATESANGQTVISLTHGQYDPLIPILFAHQSYQHLVTLGYNVSWKTYPGAHEITNPQITDIATWLTDQLTD